MTTAPRLSDSQFCDDNARRYLLSLRSGIKPDIRPEFGAWESLIREVEKSFDGMKPEKRAAQMPKRLETIGNLPRFREKHVLDLLSEREEKTEQGEALEMPMLLAEAQLPPAVQALAPQACPWLAEHYIPYSQKASPEGYADFHEDCGLFDLAAISARRIRIPIGNGEYTPLSIALVAKPGTYAKSTTAEVSVRVLLAADLGWLLGSDETTPQKLLSDMAGKYVDKHYARWDLARKEEYRERKAMSAQVAWYCDEFGELVKSINKPTGPMADLKKLLLKFDNCPPVYSTSTVTRGREEIAKPFLSFLGVMTPASIKKNARESSEEWGDGTWSRFVFSCAPDDDGLDCPFDYETPIPPALSEPLREYHERLGLPEIEIEEILDKKGETVIDYAINPQKALPETIIDHKPIAEYWIRYRSALKKMLKNIPEDLKASYIRLPARALRVAALFASFEGLDHMELKHWAKAQEIAERWRRNLHRFYAQVNISETPTSVTKTIEEKIQSYCEANAEQTDLDKIPTARNLSRYTRAATGLINTILIDLKRAKIISERKRGKATYYIPYADEDG